MTADAPVEAHASRTYAAPCSRTFASWLDPEKAAHWLSHRAVEGSQRTLRRAEVDSRVGGEFSFADRLEGEEINRRGKYLHIDHPRRLAFTWSIPRYSPDPHHVAIDFVPASQGCRVDFTFGMDARWSDHAGRTRHAWQLMLDSIARVVE